jgi:hypothetical protein
MHQFAINVDHLKGSMGGLKLIKGVAKSLPKLIFSETGLKNQHFFRLRLLTGV